jgi:hypothetical protein
MPVWRLLLKLIFGKPKWEMWDDPLEVFLQRVKASGFDATEIYLGSLQESAAEIARLHAHYGLRLIGQILTQGQSPWIISGVWNRSSSLLRNVRWSLSTAILAVIFLASKRT